MAAQSVSHHLRLVAAWVVEACRMHGEEHRHSLEGQVDRRAANRAKGVSLHIAAVARHIPKRRLAGELHLFPARECQIGSMSSAALLLTSAALAVNHHERFVFNLISNRAASASTAVSLAHPFSPLI